MDLKQLDATFELSDARGDNGSQAFDPLRSLFVAQASRPEELRQINLRALSPYERALLMIDGTVTKFIEAYTLDPVEVVRLRQQTVVLTKKHTWLEVEEDTSVVEREVMLRSKYSRSPLAYAVSLIAAERLPDIARRRLSHDGDGLGRILLGCQMETRRELLWYGVERPLKPVSALPKAADREFISRTYRIIGGGRPIMVINEKFIREGDGLPTHH